MNLETGIVPRPILPSRAAIRARYGVDEAQVVADLRAHLGLSPEARQSIAAEGARLVRCVRAETRPTLMESFLAEYGLSTDEGVGLMCLAEALLRVPDAQTVDELIHDKIEPSDWAAHLGQSASPMVNASTWALMLTGRVLDDDPSKPATTLRALVRRLGEPVIRTAVGEAMKMLGRQFVLGQTIAEGVRNARTLEGKGYTYSYDMLGEAARTEADAARYYQAYQDAIRTIAAAATGDIRTAPGISVKLSALHPRYEYTHRAQSLPVVVERLTMLARMAAEAGIGCNVDAEEQDRLEVSLDVIEAVLADPALAGWDGFGVVVQGYGRRALPVIEHLDALAERHNRRLMVRLVKGAYWDTEIKRAQEDGVETFPVFTRKANTDLSYLACAESLLARRARLYPQFATHNAHTCAAIVAMAGNDREGYEFQRLHGMGEALHEILRREYGTSCRVYAPVGAHRDLLAYLVRRLLENGANSSFVNQIVDGSVPPERIAADPVAAVEAETGVAHAALTAPADLFAPERVNARGVALNEPASIEPLLAERARFADHVWQATPMLADGSAPEGVPRRVVSPADPERVVGHVVDAGSVEVARALDLAEAGFGAWSATPVSERAACLRAVAEAYERATPELCALLAREAGKTVSDAVAEIREAVDFLRYYAAEAVRLETERPGTARGVFVCISPWNFPLAIFTGQIAATLAAGNAVIAKPAEQTPLIAARAVQLMRAVGLPAGALQLLPGDGSRVGAALTADPRLAGVCFTGSTETAQVIHRTLAANAAADAVLIAETGGLNAMLVDTSALTEQAVRDIVASAFQSGGQRCSALRLLYVQKEARARLLEMLYGAMDALTADDPWHLATDIAPIIDPDAQAGIEAYVAQAEAEGRLLKRIAVPAQGSFAAPAVIAVEGIADLGREVFGPVLHVASFGAEEIDTVIEAVNERGYGLTFGLHTRIDDRVARIVERLEVGNIYVNRNQIGAVVGSQPFGGEGLSGTGPKAGGPQYLTRFRREVPPEVHAAPVGEVVSTAALEEAFAALDAGPWSRRPDRCAVLEHALADPAPLVTRALAAAGTVAAGPLSLPGPTGESNRLGLHPRGAILCLGPTAEIALAQAVQALAAGCAVVLAAPDGAALAQPLIEAGVPLAAFDATVAPETLSALKRLDAVAAAGVSEWTAALRGALAAREGAIVALVSESIAPERYWVERHLCIDTTAAGGNASLLAASV
ncbi:MAG: bifunctional proline dehydrogenase/L-glutamate gamma-semialdehyde dehydrogenase PutA [Pseudomonadota bacterium]